MLVSSRTPWRSDGKEKHDKSQLSGGEERQLGRRDETDDENLPN